MLLQNGKGCFSASPLFALLCQPVLVTHKVYIIVTWIPTPFETFSSAAYRINCCDFKSIMTYFLSCLDLLRSMKHPTMANEAKLRRHKKIKFCQSWNDVSSYSYDQQSNKEDRIGGG